MNLLNLRQLDNPGDADERIVHWAKIFKAKTQQELEELAGEQEVLKKMVTKLRQLSDDEKIKIQMEARADYESRIATAEGAGYRKGIERGRLLEIVKFVKDGLCTTEVGAERAGMTIQDFKMTMEEMN